MSNFADAQLGLINAELEKAHVPDGPPAEGVRILARRLELLYDPLNRLVVAYPTKTDSHWELRRSNQGGVGVDTLGTGPTPWEALDDAIAREGEG